MKLTVFQSDKGDSLLLESTTGGNPPARMLVDGGMRNSYKAHVRAHLSEVPELDAVCVSHIDQDHISGVLQLLDDVVEWRVFEHQKKQGNPIAKQPKFARPPAIKEIWHNGFSEQVGHNAGPVEEMLATSSKILFGAKNSLGQLAAMTRQDIVTGTREGIQLSRRIATQQLNIPLNQPSAGKLMLVRDGQQPIRLGPLRIHLIAPFASDVTKLRKEWNEWLAANEGALQAIREKAQEDQERLGLTDFDACVGMLAMEARVLGDRSRVTTPNLASIMLLAEEGSQSALLTGDGHHEDILKGLERVGKLAAGGGLHVNILKVQHHGSEHNTNQKFCRRVTADNYVFCGNGEHGNPDQAVVEAFIDSRLGPPGTRSTNDETSRPFKLWFNSSSLAVRDKQDNADHMRQLATLVKQRASHSGGTLTYTFLRGSSLLVTP